MLWAEYRAAFWFCLGEMLIAFVVCVVELRDIGKLCQEGTGVEFEGGISLPRTTAEAPST